MKDDHICIVAYHMIPNTRVWGASQRMYYLANQIIDQGQDCTVIHANFGQFEHEGKTNKFTSISVDIKPKIMQALQENMQNIEKKPDAGNMLFKENKFKSFLKHLYRFFEENIFNDFGYIGLFVSLWSKRAFVELENLIKTQNVKVLIISGPYFTTFNLVKKIKRRYPDVKILLDYRDPWNQLRKGSFLTRCREKQLIKKADRIIFFSDRFKQYMIENFGASKKKSIVAYNGFDEDLWKTFKKEDKVKNQSKLVISYVGSDVTFTKGSGRDPSILIDSIKDFNFSEDIILNIVGCKDIPQKYTEDPKFKFLQLTSLVSHKESLKFLNESDVVVVLSTDDKPSEFTVTGKLFDCMRSGKYILGISNSPQIDYVRLIKEHKLGNYCVNTNESINLELKKIYERWKSSKLHTYQQTDINHYSRRIQNDKILKEIENIIS